jgi:hypothetical protein
MAFEQRDNSGSIFRNDKREKDSHPNATGSAVIDGVAYWVSAWTKKDKNGNPWQSLAFKKKEERSGDTVKRNPGPMKDDGEDFPF